MGCRDDAGLRWSDAPSLGYVKTCQSGVGEEAAGDRHRNDSQRRNIGWRKGAAYRAQPLSAESRRRQAAIMPSHREENTPYGERFGFPTLVGVVGREWLSARALCWARGALIPSLASDVAQLDGQAP